MPPALDETQDTAGQPAELEQRMLELERENAELRIAKTRAEVAAAKGVPAELLTGTDQFEIEATADRLLEFRGHRVPVGAHLPNQDKSPETLRHGLGEMARRFFAGQ